METNSLNRHQKLSSVIAICLTKKTQKFFEEKTELFFYVDCIKDLSDKNNQNIYSEIPSLAENKLYEA